jgi:heat shock factor-binding protein 1
VTQNQRFKAMSDTIIGRIDEMGGRIEELERSINDLVAQSAPGGSSAGSAPAPGGGGR